MDGKKWIVKMSIQTKWSKHDVALHAFSHSLELLGCFIEN